MFSKGKKHDEHSNLPAIPQGSNGKRPMRSAPSIISSDLIVLGTLTSTGDIQIDGRVEGDIRSGSVTIGEKANIEGEIVAEEVIIRGRVQGTIRARKVQLSGTCHVEGIILHEALAVEVGAFFEGQCRHSADPLSEAAPRPDAGRPVFEPKRDLASNHPQATSIPVNRPALISSQGGQSHPQNAPTPLPGGRSGGFLSGGKNNF
jgi:cytoskeletal protein CcmA (bactofilin family)